MVGDFLLLGLITAFIMYTITNRLLLAPTSHSSALLDSRVEFAYAFDIAVNAFFPTFLTIGVAMMPLAGVLVKDSWICLFAGK